MKKGIKSVLSMTAIAAMVPFAVSAAETTIPTIEGGKVDTAIATITESSNLGKDYTIRSGGLEINASSKDIVLNLQDHSIILEEDALTIKGANKVTIKGGNIVCQRETDDCVSSALTNLTLENVNITSNEGNALNVGEATIKNSNLTAKTTALTVATSVTYENGVIKGDISDATKVVAKGNVTGPHTLAAKASEKTTITVTNSASDEKMNLGTPANANVTVDFSKYDFSDLAKEYDVTYSKDYTVKGIPNIFGEADNSSVATRHFVIKAADTSKLDEAKAAYDKLTLEEKTAIADKYDAENYKGYTVAAFAKSTTYAGKDIRSQGEIDSLVKLLNKMLNKQDLEPSDTDVVKPSTPSTGDDEPKENPQTFDALLSYVGMAIASVGGIAVSLKKSLFR